MIFPKTINVKEKKNEKVEQDKEDRECSGWESSCFIKQRRPR